MTRHHRCLTVEIIILSLFLSLFLNQSVFPRQYKETFSPWFLSGKDSAHFEIHAIPQPSMNKLHLITSNVHKDTTLFSEIETPMPGVIGGDASWIDYDDDADLDILMTGYTDSIFVTRIYRNDGANTFTDIHADLIQLATERGVAWGDYDNDGDYDFALQGRYDSVGSVFVTRIYRNNNGTFTNIEAPLLGTVGSTVLWVDYDCDGDLDLLVSGSPDQGSTFYMKLYRNDEGSFIDTQMPLPGVWASSSAFADYDNDGDPDLLITGYGTLGTTTILYRNDRINGQVSFVSVPASLPVVNSGAVTWFDYDLDGDPDILISGTMAGDIATTKIFRNDGGDQFVDIGAALAPVALSAVAAGDYDNDGDPDLAIAGGENWYHGSNPTTRIYRNDNGAFIETGIRLPGVYAASLAWGDYDNDGKLDLLITGGTMPRQYPGNWQKFYPITKLFHNNTPQENTPPSQPSTLQASMVNGELQLAWSGSNDGQTVTGALTYNVSIGRTAGAFDILSPNANLSSGYRRVVESGNSGVSTTHTIALVPGTYYWTVQAVDNGYASSNFAPEQSFTITPTGILENGTTPLSYRLLQNYPNPFNPVTTIKYEVSRSEHVSLIISNVLGKEVTTLVNEQKEPGRYQVQWNASTYPSGVYFYTVRAGTFTETRKLIFIQ